MSLRTILALSVIAFCGACNTRSTDFNWSNYQAPDWHQYRVVAAMPGEGVQTAAAPSKLSKSDRVSFRDLKTESDSSLARRLLGAAGTRITFIDRHVDGWPYFQSDNDPAQSITLYTHPAALGSNYGLCRAEMYTVHFDDAGYVSSVSVSNRYGVEGAVHQKNGFDWESYYKVICNSAPSFHARFYFPASDSFTAQNLAMLLIPVIDLARKPGPLAYNLECIAADQPCREDARSYLASLRLENIDGFDLSNCPLAGGPQAVCFTITTGEGELGPFPKKITVKGSTYMNNVRVDSVHINEGFTMS